MVTPKKPGKKVVENVPRTKGEIEKARKLGSMLGFLKQRVGRPPAEKQKRKKSTATKRKDPPSSTRTTPSSKKNQRNSYVNWDDHPKILQEHIDARRNKRNAC